MTAPRRSPAAEVVEDYTDLARDLIKKWSDWGAHVANNLDEGAYQNAGTASADLAGGVSLTIETGFKLAWEAVDAYTILARGESRHVVESDEFTVAAGPATLDVSGDLQSGFGYTLPAHAVHIIVLSSGNGETEFKLRVDATDCRAGTYWGTVTVSTTQPGAGPLSQDVTIWVTIP